MQFRMSSLYRAVAENCRQTLEVHDVGLAETSMSGSVRHPVLSALAASEPAVWVQYGSIIMPVSLK